MVLAPVSDFDQWTYGFYEQAVVLCVQEFFGTSFVPVAQNGCKEHLCVQPDDSDDDYYDQFDCNHYDDYSTNFFLIDRKESSDVPTISCFVRSFI